MNKKSLLPQSPVCSVRADTSIGDCVRILRDKSIGALVVTGDNVREEIVGIFTERDLVKNIELIQKGSFWASPVRTVMSTAVRTVTVENLKQAPKIMARYNIRHLPIVAEEKGKKRIIGVLSMRDIFGIVMEQIDYDLDKVFFRPTPMPKAKKKLVGVFSKDRAILDLIDNGTRFTKHVVVKAAEFKDEADQLADYLAKFDVLFIDIDGMKGVQLAKLLAQSRSITREHVLYVAFSPPKLNAEASAILHKLTERKQIHVLSKPIALGLLYEKFFKEIA